MNKSFQITFFKADFAQYNCILEDDEIRNKIAGFVLKYVSVEAFYKKLLIAMKEKDGNKLPVRDKQNQKVKMPEIKKVMEYYDIAYDEQLLERIFGSEDKNYMCCSIKKLHDRLVHNVNDNVLRVILERYDDMDADLNAFIALFS